MNFNDQMKKYAQVLLKIGVSLERGQPLCIEAPVSAEKFVSIIAEEAWKTGCTDVEVLWKSALLDHKQLFYMEPKSSEFLFAQAQSLAAREAAYIRLDTPEFYDDGAGAERIRKRSVIDGEVRSILRNSPGGATLACVPGQSWADKVFPDVSGEKRMSRLWEAVLDCCYCDKPDPVAEWERYLKNTSERKKILDERHYTEFHYISPDTDLTISPAEGDFWKGSPVMEGERMSVPNIPTQEVFMSPHKYSAEGIVKVTKPLNFGGELIDGIRLTFSEGCIVKWEAENGLDLLTGIIGTDEGSHYLGEISLVDEFTPIAKFGRLFYTTLYDENASCHIAIGNTIGPPFDPEVKEKRGYNTSSMHVDLMVGSEDLTIKGRLPDGTWEDLLVNGRLTSLN